MESDAISLQATQDRDPFEFYRFLSELGVSQWDAGAGAWLAATYASCSAVLKADTVAFRHPDGDRDQPFHYISRGRRGLKTVVGDDHRRLHRWMLLSFSPAKMSARITELVRDVIAGIVDELAGFTELELVAQFANRVPPQVICALFGLPWRDRVWMNEVKEQLDALAAYFNRRLAATVEDIDAARSAMDRLRAILGPFIQASQDSAGDDLLASLWRDGPSIFQDWNEEDVFMVLTTVLLAGSDTTTLAISNALHLLLTDASWRSWARQADDSAIAALTEEVLRLWPPVHYRVRRANDGAEFDGAALAGDSFVIPLLAAANRDASHYSCPHAIDVERKSPRDHLSFSMGPRACIGSNLARLEICEAIRQFLAAFPAVRLDPKGEAPAYRGLVLRRFSPLHVLVGAE